MVEKKSKASLFGAILNEFCLYTTIIFCTLRATNVIAWGWFWVLSPLIFSTIIGLLCFVCVGIAVGVIATKKGVRK